MVRYTYYGSSYLLQQSLDVGPGGKFSFEEFFFDSLSKLRRLSSFGYELNVVASLLFVLTSIA